THTHTHTHTQRPHTHIYTHTPLPPMPAQNVEVQMLMHTKKMTVSPRFQRQSSHLSYSKAGLFNRRPWGRIRPSSCFGLAPGVCSGSIIQFVTMANCTLSRAVGGGIHPYMWRYIFSYSDRWPENVCL